MAEGVEVALNIIVKWNGCDYKINLMPSSNILDLKNSIYKETNVLPERQKLMGLKFKGKIPGDEVCLKDLQLKDNLKIMMMGTQEEEIAKVTEGVVEYPEVVNDLDIEEEVVEIQNKAEYLSKIEKRINTYQINILNNPRPNKKLLVLDIDYTLFDHRSVGETGSDLMRPYLHEFLTSSYADYDIVIWSATSMKWIEAKMNELGVSKNPNYKLCFMLDSLAMITVHVSSYGVIDVKPLGVIWGKFPQWNKHNTIMFDDLRRNFIMNPQNGLKIRPFKNAHTNRSTDKELKKLSKYLKYIAPLDDFTALNHSEWESYYKSKKRGHHPTS
ncbi:hypothetical protein HELRODRAFT_156877 [Helobdella robusta]|uniref:Ubiquitin-like domain-containing CTD phosphatase 1 n=1 Tax=Helobdella robusta TaxID=6412 RepID=T1EM24_HELRO|nr:hypothetical protein HELRODRAFT_156877 [Helobdella robusta]ESO05305.1 hypothetical protein HELRODRAFT_156877 [Helobdella robusta]